MKKIIKKIIEIVLKGWSYVYAYRISEKVKGFKNSLYTIWIKKCFACLGENTTIHYPCTLEGNGHEIWIGKNSTIQKNCVLGCWNKYGEQVFSPTIRIGDGCSIGEYNHISSINKVIIGDGLLSGRFVYIGDNSHGILSKEGIEEAPARRPLISKGEVIIGKNVWIGDKATILAGVHIGDNVIIGANTVVTKDIPSNCIAAGVPAKIIKSI